MSARKFWLGPALLVCVVTFVACGETVLICRERGEGVICRKRFMTYSRLNGGGSRPLNLPRTSRLRVPYDDGTGVAQTDPASLVGQRVVLRLAGGKELWTKIVDVTEDEVVVRYRGSKWSYRPDEIALLTPLGD